MIKEGSAAPDFSLQDDSGKEVSLNQLRGKKVVLYFYPKDDTPGCTREACSFRDDYAKYKNANAVIYGISADSAQSHRKFKEKYSLPFPLLIDSDHHLAKQFGAWGEKDSYGQKSMGLIRSTFVIDEKGNVEKIYRNVKVDGHSEQLLGQLSPSK